VRPGRSLRSWKPSHLPKLIAVCDPLDAQPAAGSASRTAAARRSVTRARGGEGKATGVPW
jgi:hypothetical protein